MKTFFASLMAVALLTGCATQRQVANLEGHGKRAVFTAPYENVWRAAIDAAQSQDLEVRSADPQAGYISTGRGVRPETFGENVGIWVRELAPGQTQVEVVSRQAGPPVLWIKSWETRVLNAIAANLTRDSVRGYSSMPSVPPPRNP
jgi:hypothetical protein